MSFYEMAKNRYSCRNYADKPIPDDVLEKLLSVIQLAPSSCNLQTHHVYVCLSEESHEKLEQHFRFRWGNPVYLLLSIDEDRVWHDPKRDNHPSSEVDGAIVLTQLMFQARDLGLDTCWIGSFDHAGVKEDFLPKNEEPIGILAVGYAAEGDKPSSQHEARQEVHTYYTYLR